jgi:hypothetical protein
VVGGGRVQTQHGGGRGGVQPHLELGVDASRLYLGLGVDGPIFLIIIKLKLIITQIIYIFNINNIFFSNLLIILLIISIIIIFITQIIIFLIFTLLIIIKIKIFIM